MKKIEAKAFNFHKVTDGVYRCGLISKQAAPLLKELGVKTVVTFDDNLKRVQKERTFLGEQKINLVSIPWSGWDYPDDRVVEQALTLLDSREARPIVIHCKHGQERTGVVIASWRVSRENWPVEQAYLEMKAHGFRPFQYGHLKEYLYEYARRRGQVNAVIDNPWEQKKTKAFSFFYNLRKMNLSQKK
ncbi:MAG: dual specificity protein phosphatase family protein [Candidatus Omnitrophica bacterium]|nr:dual specificity protein phosphatase family protein [Candidatus Omnitrophota bacterium]